jgi:hypothetical protein
MDLKYFVVGDDADRFSVAVLRYPANGTWMMGRASHHPKCGRNEAGRSPRPRVSVSSNHDKNARQGSLVSRLVFHKLQHDASRTHATPTTGPQIT